MGKFDFEEIIISKSRFGRIKERMKSILVIVTKLLNRKDIPETAKDDLRDIRKLASTKDEE